MSSIDVVKNQFVTLQYLPEQKMLYHIVHKPVDEEIFKSTLNTGVEMLSKNGIRKWLSDDRKNGPFSQAFSKWAINDWIPHAIEAGWQYWANVVPEDMEAAGTLMPFIEVLQEKGLRMATFADTEKAMEWLENIDIPKKDRIKKSLIPHKI
jgi:hypothetical protein